MSTQHKCLQMLDKETVQIGKSQLVVLLRHQLNVGLNRVTTYHTAEF